MTPPGSPSDEYRSGIPQSSPKAQPPHAAPPNDLLPPVAIVRLSSERFASDLSLNLESLSSRVSKFLCSLGSSEPSSSECGAMVAMVANNAFAKVCKSVPVLRTATYAPATVSQSMPVSRPATHAPATSSKAAPPVHTLINFEGWTRQSDAEERQRQQKLPAD